MQFLVCAKFIYLFIINNTSIATIRDFTNLYVRLGAFSFHKTLEDFLIPSFGLTFPITPTCASYLLIILICSNPSSMNGYIDICFISRYLHHLMNG